MELTKLQVDWISSLARSVLGENPQPDHTTLARQTQMFSEELCECLEKAARAFNEFMGPLHVHLICHTFRLGQPRTGMMMLRGKEKLVISAEPGKILVKAVFVQSYAEVSQETFEIVAKLSPRNTLEWWIVDTSASREVLVTPDLVLRYYLGNFFANGCQHLAAQVTGRAETTHRKNADNMEAFGKGIQ